MKLWSSAPVSPTAQLDSHSSIQSLQIRTAVVVSGLHTHPAPAKQIPNFPKQTLQPPAQPVYKKQQGPLLLKTQALPQKQLLLKLRYQALQHLQVSSHPSRPSQTQPTSSALKQTLPSDSLWQI